MKSFREFARLWPECRHAFIGDNGQGDVRAAEIMSSLGFGREHPFFSPSFENDTIPGASMQALKQPDGEPKEKGADDTAKTELTNSPPLPDDSSALASYLSQHKSCPTKSGCLQVAYINKILPVRCTFGNGDPISWRKHHIIFIDTYIDAAIHAATHSYCCRSRIQYHRSYSEGIDNTADGERISLCSCQEPSNHRSIYSSANTKGSFHSSMMSFAGLERVCLDSIRDSKKLDRPSDARGWRKGFSGTSTLSCYARELYRLKLASSIHNANTVLKDAGFACSSSLSNVSTNSVSSLSSTSEITPPESLPFFSIGARVAVRRPTQVESFLGNGSRSHYVPAVFGSGRGGPGEFGCDGVVVGFRPAEGVYVVDLVRWRLGDGKYAKGYFMLDQLAPISSDKLKASSPRDDRKGHGSNSGSNSNSSSNSSNGGVVSGGMSPRRPVGKSDVPHGWASSRFGFFRGDDSDHRTIKRMFKSKLKAIRGSLSSNKTMTLDVESDEEGDCSRFHSNDPLRIVNPQELHGDDDD